MEVLRRARVTGDGHRMRHISCIQSEGGCVLIALVCLPWEGCGN